MTPTNIKNENYTPAYFLNPCYEFLGGFDLDPFASELTANVVKAKTYFTEEDDGLKKDWSKYRRKWVNPPYSGGLIVPCVLKTLLYEDIGETLLLVNSSTSAKWYHACLETCSALLFPFKRIQFFNPYQERQNRNRYDQTLFYFGPRTNEFAKQLSPLGNVFTGYGVIK